MNATYVRLQADVVRENGDAGGGSSAGGEMTGYWLFWTSNGYTNLGWYWDEPDNFTKQGWANYLNTSPGGNGTAASCQQVHAATAEGLSEHIAGGHADDLNKVIGDWPNGMKTRFVGDHYEDFEAAGCLRD